MISIHAGHPPTGHPPADDGGRVQVPCVAPSGVPFHIPPNSLHLRSHSSCVSQVKEMPVSTEICAIVVA
jgi:hypothetical protein